MTIRYGEIKSYVFGVVVGSIFTADPSVMGLMIAIVAAFAVSLAIDVVAGIAWLVARRLDSASPNFSSWVERR